MTGTDNLNNQIQSIKQGHSIKLSEYAHLGEAGQQSYFQNKLGGLGQYYLGVFREFDMMRGTISGGVKNTEEMGIPVAESFAKGADHDLFIKTLEEDLVTIERLNELSKFCACQIANSPVEQEVLCDMFFVRGEFYDRQMLERRYTLQTILHVADNLSKVGEELNIKLFRACVYNGSLPNGANIEIPENLKPTLQRWAIYQRNELLSISVQGLFFVLLESYAESGNIFLSTQEICQWFSTTEEVKDSVPFDSKETTFGMAKNILSKELAFVENGLDENHEIQYAFEIESLCKQKNGVENRVSILKKCFKIISALCTRDYSNTGYGSFVFNKKNYLDYYKINLRSFDYHAANTWENMKFDDWLIWMLSEWGIDAHLKVALRKLRGQSKSTFRIRPTDIGFEVVEVPAAVFTNPRFKQALQILIDIGVLHQKDGTIFTTELGQSLKEMQDD